MTRKYGIGILSAIIAISAVAFTKPGKGLKPLVSYTFHYTSTNYSQNEVQKNNNWSPGASTSCGTPLNKACQMDVLATYTHDDGSGTQVLNTTGSVLSISAVKGANNTDFVPSSSSAISNISDKP
ncbi:MAG: hypothetical protein QM764_08900 [Chitinophagaceae bacterium]